MSRGRLGILAGWGYCGLLLAFVLVPVAIMVPASFGASPTLEFPPRSLSLRWYEQVMGDQRWLDSAWLSFRLALFAAVVATLAGLMVGLAHMRFGRVKPVLRAYLMLPLVAPHIVLATGLFLLLLQARFLGNPVVLGLGQACFAIPMTVVVFIHAVETIDPLLWTAAASLGARWWMILREVVIPNLLVSMAVAFLLSFISAWDEVTLAVFIGPIHSPTLPARMYSYLQELINPSVTAIATLLLAMTLVIGGASLLLRRRKAVAS